MVLVLLVVLVAGARSAHLLLAWGTHRLGERVVRALPAQIDAADRERLRQGLECATRAARERQASEPDLRALVRACQEALADRAVTLVEAERIRQAAQRCCGLPREEAMP